MFALQLRILRELDRDEFFPGGPLAELSMGQLSRRIGAPSGGALASALDSLVAEALIARIDRHWAEKAVYSITQKGCDLLRLVRR